MEYVKPRMKGERSKVESKAECATESQKQFALAVQAGFQEQMDPCDDTGAKELGKFFMDTFFDIYLICCELNTAITGNEEKEVCYQDGRTMGLKLSTAIVSALAKERVYATAEVLGCQLEPKDAAEIDKIFAAYPPTDALEKLAVEMLLYSHGLITDPDKRRNVRGSIISFVKRPMTPSAYAEWKKQFWGVAAKWNDSDDVWELFESAHKAALTAIAATAEQAS